jgi:hypothetical protein
MSNRLERANRRNLNLTATQATDGLTADGDAAPGVPHALMRTPSWRERHMLKLLGVVMVAMFTLVIVTQVAC